MISSFRFLEPRAFFWLWFSIILVIFGIYGIIKKRKILETLLTPNSKNIKTYIVHYRLLLILATSVSILAVFSAARPSLGQTESIVSKKGRDVVFVIDVSRSMLAEDLYPDRLSRAKLAIIDALSAIDGDRVGLVAFAGTAVVKCPLTLDYSFFKQSVEELTTESVSIGGSMIGDALRKTMKEVFLGGNGGFRDVILITDGEDQESYPLKAAESLGEAGIRLIAIGLGDENSGKRIPVTDDKGNKVFLTHDGKEVWSRLDALTLRKMTAATPDGRYLNVATGTFNMGEIYSTLIKSQQKRFIEDQKTTEYNENYQYLLLPTVVLFFIYLFLKFVYKKDAAI